MAYALDPIDGFSLEKLGESWGPDPTTLFAGASWQGGSFTDIVEPRGLQPLQQDAFSSPSSASTDTPGSALTNLSSWDDSPSPSPSLLDTPLDAGLPTIGIIFQSPTAFEFDSISGPSPFSKHSPFHNLLSPSQSDVEPSPTVDPAELEPSPLQHFRNLSVLDEYDEEVDMDMDADADTMSIDRHAAGNQAFQDSDYEPPEADSPHSFAAPRSPSPLPTRPLSRTFQSKSPIHSRGRKTSFKPYHVERRTSPSSTLSLSSSSSSSLSSSHKNRRLSSSTEPEILRINGRYVCNMPYTENGIEIICTQSCVRAHDVRRHRASAVAHNPNAAQVCPFCGDTFAGSRRDSVARHMANETSCKRLASLRHDGYVGRTGIPARLDNDVATVYVNERALERFWTRQAEPGGDIYWTRD